MVNKFFFCGILDLVHKAFIVEKKNVGCLEGNQYVLHTKLFSILKYE